MRSRRFIPIVIVIAALLAGAKTKDEAAFVSPDSFDFKSILAPPPTTQSDETQQEIKHILSLQSTRSPAEVKRAISEENVDPFLFSDVLGSWFTADNLPATAELLDKVHHNAMAIKDVCKVAYMRDRPFLVDSRIKPCVTVQPSYSYPSGHALDSMLLAKTLILIFPDQKDGLIARAKLVGDDRILAGVHYPSDVIAGRHLADVVFEEMIKSPKFQAELAEAKEECLARNKAN